MLLWCRTSILSWTRQLSSINLIKFKFSLHSSANSTRVNPATAKQLIPIKSIISIFYFHLFFTWAISLCLRGQEKHLKLSQILSACTWRLRRCGQHIEGVRCKYDNRIRGQERHLELGQTSGNYKAQFPACENHRNVGKTYSH